MDAPEIEVVDCGIVVAGGFAAAEALFMSEEVLAPLTIMATTFCEMVTIARGDFWAIVRKSPRWLGMVNAVEHALQVAKAKGGDHYEELLQGLAECTEEALKQVGLHSETRTIIVAKVAKQAWQKIKSRMHLVTPAKHTKPKGGFHCDTPKDGQGPPTGDQVQTSGFQTMQMSSIERGLLQEVKRLQTTLSNMESNFQKEREEARKEQEEARKEQKALQAQNEYIISLLGGSKNELSNARPSVVAPPNATDQSFLQRVRSLGRQDAQLRDQAEETEKRSNKGVHTLRSVFKVEKANEHTNMGANQVDERINSRQSTLSL
eukprot:gnl/MRDRNA2_/MRDRNA2_239183_c0_seq1.p1 gnl/MRDRNA2_/MRDRNA2_239183_c0~~gnl/MRDRNA2_/MRDRNA2_239183_c0_seq1.p1  ORF type:complete len:372 (-),score=96.69 gnl/MRDRNA2_/MRDRNA2_239183_c0_seq1:6-962(-)